MGLFDSVMADCPTCGKRLEFQSKADIDPCMRVYTVETAPGHILRDVLNEPNYCQHCDQWSVLYDPAFPPNAEPPRPSPSMRKLRQPTDPDIHPTQPFLRWWNEPFSEADFAPKVGNSEGAGR